MTTFVMPTYRLREVGATVEAYDQHFHRNGHRLDPVVFDDSSTVNNHVVRVGMSAQRGR